MKFIVEPRLQVSKWHRAAASCAAVSGALAIGAVILALWGVSPLAAYRAMFSGALGSWYGFSEVLVTAIPITITATAGALCYRMMLWNIGMEGQLVLGALATVAVTRYVSVDNWFVMMMLMGLAACAAGAAWASIAGVLKAKWGVSEIITTLMLNYIGVLLVDYFIYGAWKDPTSMGFPMTAVFPDSARLPSPDDSRVHFGGIIALLIALKLWVTLKMTAWGYEIRVIGENPKAAEYAGMNIKKYIIIVMAVSGAIAGIAGMSEVAGLHGRLARGFSVGYGYAGIIVAWLAQLNAMFIPIAALFMSAIDVGGDNLQVVMGIPLAVVMMFQGVMLFCLLVGDTFCRYRIRIITGRDG